MQLYNTLGRKLEKLPKTKEVTLYTCGPTVYNYYHIGNLRNAVFNDTLKRTLEAAGHVVKHVMNITDVGHLASDADEGEDKLEKGAAREGKTVWEVADHYTEAFKRDMTAMNIQPPSVNPKRAKNREAHDPYARATDFIDEQIDMIKALLHKSFAYQTEQAIYFDVTKLKNYGELSGQNLKDKEVAARSEVVTDTHKRHPHDFAIWFFTVGRYAEHSMRWPSPWGEGFPGWHLECSAIIHATLGEPITIHTGGVDHIGTHHPNEMAQTEAAFDHPLAHFWVHNEFVLVDGAKMAKSKGNSYTLQDVLDHGFHPLALRLLYLQAHYRSELNFTWESLEAAQQRLSHYHQLAAHLYQPLYSDQSGLTSLDLEPYFQSISDALASDLNTPAVLVEVSKLQEEVTTKGIDNTSSAQQTFKDLIAHIDDVLGLDLTTISDITPSQKQLITQREAARKAKAWAMADQLRHQLREQNLEIDDTPSGPRWRRTKIE